jgi:hypothetical protein
LSVCICFRWMSFVVGLAAGIVLLAGAFVSMGSALLWL